MKKFWKWDNVNSDLQAKMEANLRLGQLFLYTFLICGFITMGIYFFKAFTNTDGDMNFECYVPNKFFLTFETIQYLQVYFLLGAYFIVAGFDILYMCCSINLVNQLKLLQFKLRTLDVRSKNKESNLVGYVQYHDFLIELRFFLSSNFYILTGFLFRFAQRMRRVYSHYFLCHYMITLATVCSQLYELPRK